MKPNCYECKWRQDIPGDAHSRCVHPEVAAVISDDNPIGALVQLLGARLPVGPLIEKLGVTGDPHGIRCGWFNWPVNFDPVWLLSCAGFENRERRCA